MENANNNESFSMKKGIIYTAATAGFLLAGGAVWYFANKKRTNNESTLGETIQDFCRECELKLIELENQFVPNEKTG